MARRKTRPAADTSHAVDTVAADAVRGPSGETAEGDERPVVRSGTQAFEDWLAASPDPSSSVAITRSQPTHVRGVQIRGYLETWPIREGADLGELHEYVRQKYGGGEYKLQWRQSRQARFASGFCTIQISGEPILQTRVEPPPAVVPALPTFVLPQSSTPQQPNDNVVMGIFELLRQQLAATGRSDASDVLTQLLPSLLERRPAPQTTDPFASFQQILDAAERLNRLRGGGSRDSNPRRRDDDDDDDFPGGGGMARMLMSKLFEQQQPPPQPPPPMQSRLPAPPPGYTWMVRPNGEAVMVAMGGEQPRSAEQPRASNVDAPKPHDDDADDDDADDDDTDEQPLTAEELVDDLESLPESEKQRAVMMLIQRMGGMPSMDNVAEFPSPPIDLRPAERGK